jgi:hypothetical protein
MRPRVRCYGDLDAGGLLPRCVDRLFGKQSMGWRVSLGRLRWAEPASRNGDRTTRRLSRTARGRAWSLLVESRRSGSAAALEYRREPDLIMMCRS